MSILLVQQRDRTATGRDQRSRSNQRRAAINSSSSAEINHLHSADRLSDNNCPLDPVISCMARPWPTAHHAVLSLSVLDALTHTTCQSTYCTLSYIRRFVLLDFFILMREVKNVPDFELPKRFQFFTSRPMAVTQAKLGLSLLVQRYRYMYAATQPKSLCRPCQGIKPATYPSQFHFHSTNLLFPPYIQRCRNRTVPLQAFAILSSMVFSQIIFCALLLLDSDDRKLHHG